MATQAQQNGNKSPVKDTKLGITAGVAHGVQVVNVDTKLAKGSPSVTTELQMDWDGVKAEDLFELARRSVIINYQRVQRDAGKIPAKDSMKVAEFMAGKGRPDRVVTPEKILATAEKMDEKAQLALIKQLQDSLKSKGKK